MDRIDRLRIFVRVVECSSFTKAANILQVPRSTVSVAIRELEQLVGARLLQRTTRSVAATEDGRAYYDLCVRLLADYDDAETIFTHGAMNPKGRLRINVPGRLGRLIIAPALPGFFNKYPDIELDMGVTDRAVDLVQEGIDCVVRVGELNDSSLVARKLGNLPLINCASPDYVARYGLPQTVKDLGRHFAVNYASPTTGRIARWEYTEDGHSAEISMRSFMTVNTAEAYIACCEAGLGLIQIPAYDVEMQLRAGSLVEVLSSHRAEPMPIAILYPHRQHLSPRLQVMVDWLADLFSRTIL
ncbi:LysR family transcriptional regulator [Phyllobacterium myrsinacearum]|uniref:DNA-binding transcriptional LysR family regulator n=1 Tax=Phyllobacterium myrsinacearum TaxID=28101 RepID=A0A839EX18_9HYPH|nr:LysR family transcriptional regulator [Phyllobacterium myrsinacearum]MBA8880937.1 DNA-binding transcriptional LysR family regulator [Phyllobacterium myrsinacearum]